MALHDSCIIFTENSPRTDRRPSGAASGPRGPDKNMDKKRDYNRSHEPLRRGWWRYNAALMRLFDAAGRRIGFASSASTVADVGSNLAERPADIAADRTAALLNHAGDHLVLYLYIHPPRCPRTTKSTRPGPSGSR